MRELVEIGAVTVEHRFAGSRRLTNRYHLNSTQPPDAAGARAWTAAEPVDGRTTTSNAVEEDHFRISLGITEPDAFAADIAALRREAGDPSARWARPSLVAALQAAVKARGWPAADAVLALRIVAADPATRSPMRLAEAGPWWDEAAAAASIGVRVDARTDVASVGEPPTERIEAELAEADGLRVQVHRQLQLPAYFRAIAPGDAAIDVIENPVHQPCPSGGPSPCAGVAPRGFDFYITIVPTKS